jgi:hypothetical protein
MPQIGKRPFMRRRMGEGRPGVKGWADYDGVGLARMVINGGLTVSAAFS